LFRVVRVISRLNHSRVQYLIDYYRL